MSIKNVIGIDLDGVIRDFNSMLTQLHNATLGIENVDKWVTPDFECEEYGLFSHESHYDLPALNKVWKEHPLEIMLFARPYKNYSWFLDEIRALKNPLDDILFITHQYTEDAKIATKLWGKKYKLDNYGDMIFESGDEKWRHCNVLIDDKVENLTQLELNNPISTPICCARAWNQNIKKNIFRGDYNEIIAYLRVQ